MTRDPRPPLNSIFANQFECITRKKLRVSVLKVAITGPHLTLYKRNAINYTIEWQSTRLWPRA